MTLLMLSIIQRKCSTFTGQALQSRPVTVNATNVISCQTLQSRRVTVNAINIINCTQALIMCRVLKLIATTFSATTTLTLGTNKISHLSVSISSTQTHTQHHNNMTQFCSDKHYTMTCCTSTITQFICAVLVASRTQSHNVLNCYVLTTSVNCIYLCNLSIKKSLYNKLYICIQK